MGKEPWEVEEEMHLTECEAMIMKAIWDHDKDYSIVELVDAVNETYEKEYKRTTVVNFLLRLSDKRFIKNYRVGRKTFIHPIISEEDFKSDLLQKQIDFWYGGKISGLVAGLYKLKSLDKKEKDIIERLLNELNAMDAGES